MKDQLIKSSIDLDGNRVKNISNPVEPKDAVNLEYLQKTLNESAFKDSVEDIQKDNTLIPKTILDSKYIILDKDNMNEGFGLIPGIGNNDIVSYDGTKFVLYFDASLSDKEFIITYNSAEDKFYQYSKTDNKWEPMNILNEMELGEGLEIKDDALRINDSVAQKFEAIIGDGTNTVFNILHNLNNSAVEVSFKDLLTNQKISGYVEYVSLNEISVSLSPAPALEQIKVIVIG